MSRRKLARERLTVIKGRARRGSAWKKRAVFYFLIVLAAVLIFQAGYHWLGSLFLSWRLQIITAEPGFLESYVETGGIITRQEVVVEAPFTGVLRELHQGGERVAAGTELAEIVIISRESVLSLQETGDHRPGEPLIVTGEIPPWFSETAAVHADAPGLLCYHIDGWETVKGFQYLSAEQFEAGSYAVEPRVAGMFVEAGEPVLKIVNNWRWYFSVILPADPGRDVAASNTVTVEFAFAPGRRIRGVKEEHFYEPSAGEIRITYRFEEQLPGFERVRWSDATVIYQRDGGILLPPSALLERKGETGVYLNSGGLVTFQPVEVIARRAEQLLVEGIPPFSLVIGRPRLVREGQRLD